MLAEPKRPPNGILLLDKPIGISSHRAMQKAARLLGASKAGHTGSLDPMACGMLPICLGEATKMAGFSLAEDKAYFAIGQLGIATDTGDLLGKIIERADARCITAAQVQAALPHFSGTIEQIPPSYSAIKQQGKRLYKLARKGQVVVPAARTVQINTLRLTQFRPTHFCLYIECGKGTYIRSLIGDIGRHLQCPATLAYLRRLWVKPFDTTPMHTLQSLQSADQPPLLPVDAGLSTPIIHLDNEQSHRLQQGQKIPLMQLMPSDLPYRLYNEQQHFIGIGICQEHELLQPKRLVRTV